MHQRFWRVDWEDADDMMAMKGVHMLDSQRIQSPNGKSRFVSHGHKLYVSKGVSTAAAGGNDESKKG